MCSRNFGQSLASNWINFSMSICCLHWFYTPSVQQRSSCFLSCSSLQFSLLPGRTHSSCVSPQLFPFLLCKHRKILRKPDDLVGSLHMKFFQAIFLHMVWILFATFGTCLSSSIGFPVVSIFLAFEAPQGSWNVLLNSLKTIWCLNCILMLTKWLEIKLF